MKLSKLLLYILLGLVLVIMDLTFFSYIEIYGASLITSLVVLTMLALSSKNDDYIYFGLILVILFSIFSSVPLFVIGLNFVLVPATINYVIKKYLPSPSTLTAVLYFIFVAFLFEFSLLVWSSEWSVVGFKAVGYFVMINAILGTIINVLYTKAKNFFLSEFEIKL